MEKKWNRGARGKQVSVQELDVTDTSNGGGGRESEVEIKGTRSEEAPNQGGEKREGGLTTRTRGYERIEETEEGKGTKDKRNEG